MKIAATIARYLLGLMFLVFGSNVFLNFIPMGQMPAGLAGQFMTALMAAHYFYVVGAIMVISAILFLVNRFVGLGLTLLAPVLFNILCVSPPDGPERHWDGCVCDASLAAGCLGASDRSLQGSLRRGWRTEGSPSDG